MRGGSRSECLEPPRITGLGLHLYQRYQRPRRPPAPTERMANPRSQTANTITATIHKAFSAKPAPKRSRASRRTRSRGTIVINLQSIVCPGTTRPCILSLCVSYSSIWACDTVHAPHAPRTKDRQRAASARPRARPTTRRRSPTCRAAPPRNSPASSRGPDHLVPSDRQLTYRSLAMAMKRSCSPGTSGPVGW